MNTLVWRLKLENGKYLQVIWASQRLDKEPTDAEDPRIVQQLEEKLRACTSDSDTPELAALVSVNTPLIESVTILSLKSNIVSEFCTCSPE